MSVHLDQAGSQGAQDDRASLAIVFIGGGVLNPWHVERWGLRAMQRMGVDVLYLDAEAARKGDRDTRAIEEGVPAFADERRLCALLRQHYPRFLVFAPFHLDQGRFRRLARLLAERRMPWCLFNTAPIAKILPAVGLNEQARYFIFQIRRILRRDGFGGTVSLVLDRVWRSAKAAFLPASRRFDPQYVLLAGTACDASVAELRARRIKAHSQDYESARARGLLAPVTVEDYCVFVDQNHPAHPDWDAQGVPLSERIDARWYTDALLKCLAVIEQTTKLKIVVLPHPRSDYEAGWFGKYEVRPGDTMREIAGARLVVGHDSTALGFAALYRKPVVLLTAGLFQHIMGGRNDRSIRAFAAELGSPVLSMDDPSSSVLDDWNSVDETLYERYVARYLRYPGSADEPLWTGAASLIVRDQGWSEPISRDNRDSCPSMTAARHTEKTAGDEDAI